MGCARAAPALLLHLNMILMVYAGAALATAARLTWDPTTYMALRELLPLEYRALDAMLVTAAVATALLAHLAVVALSVRRCARRPLLLLYAALMAALTAAEAASAVWMTVHVLRWLRSDDARQLHFMLELREHMEPLLRFLADAHPLPERLHALVQEAEEDAPRNLHVVVGAAACLLVLQPAAVLAALAAALAAPSPRSAAVLAVRGGVAEGSPLRPRRPRAVYRGGRLVMR